MITLVYKVLRYPLDSERDSSFSDTLNHFKTHPKTRHPDTMWIGISILTDNGQDVRMRDRLGYRLSLKIHRDGGIIKYGGGQ